MKIDLATLEALGTAYRALLTIPSTNRFRALNQTVYARLRDAIAEASGVDAECVQDAFEGATHHHLTAK